MILSKKINMKYQIEIRETLSRTIEIEANSLDDAVDTVQTQYRNEEIVLSSEDFINFELLLHDEHFKY